MSNYEDVYGSGDPYDYGDFSRRMSAVRRSIQVPAPAHPDRELKFHERRAAESLAALERLKDELAAQPIEPRDGGVVKLRHRFTDGGKAYTYAALRVGSRWYLTHKAKTETMSWAQLCRFANVGKIRVATGFSKLVPRGEDDGA